MRRIVLILISSVLALIIAAVAYAGKGYLDARNDAQGLKARAIALSAEGRGVSELDDDLLQILVLVEDPGFWSHRGVDLHTKGGGLTTMTQSLAKQVGFKKFRPGVGKIRQTGYAMGLETRLSKAEILTLWLDMVPMGPDADGKWVTGFYAASDAFFGKPLSTLSRNEFIQLVAIPIAPARLNPLRPTEAFEIRVERIDRLAAGACSVLSVRDVWLEGCAAVAATL